MPYRKQNDCVCIACSGKKKKKKERTIHENPGGLGQLATEVGTVNLQRRMECMRVHVRLNGV